MVKSFRGRSLASSVRASQEDSAPELVPETDAYAKVVESRGKGQFLVSLPTTTSTSTGLLVYMPPKFRNALWIRRGSFVIIRRYTSTSSATAGSTADSTDNELLHVLSPDQIKEIKRNGDWPKEFTNEVISSSESEDCEEESDSECESE